MPVLIHFYDKPALYRYSSISHRYVYTHIYTYLCTYIYFPEGMFTYFFTLKKFVNFDVSAVDGISVGLTATFAQTGGPNIQKISTPPKPGAGYAEIVDVTPELWPNSAVCGFQTVPSDKYQVAKTNDEWGDVCPPKPEDEAACQDDTTGCRDCLLAACAGKAYSPGSTICDLDLPCNFFN